MTQHRRSAFARLARRAGTVGAAVLVTAVGAVSTASAASAASAAGAVTGREQVIGRSEFSFHPTAQKGESAAKARVINCEMVFIGANHGAPHHSGHVPGTVNVRVRVTCTQAVRTISGKIGLFSTHGSKINAYGSTGKATARGNAALVCRTGYYQGESAATLRAPAGYSPPTVNMSAKTAKVHLTRCSG